MSERFNKEDLGESGNWNRADDWSREMIFRPLFEAKEYLRVAKFGCSNMEEEAFFDDKTKTKWRIEGLKWARQRFEEGVANSVFSIRTKTDKDIVIKILKELQDMEDQLDDIYSVVVDREEKKIVINEEMHNFFIKIINRMFVEVTEPFNRSDLIFIYREPFDGAKFKEETMRRFVDGD